MRGMSAVLLSHAVLTGFAPAPAAAQEAGDSVIQAEELIVTARKREERLQDIPVAVSAFSQSDLLALQVRSTDQLDHITPNLTFSSSGAFAGTEAAAQVFIRGVGQRDYLPVTDPGVALYVDGIYMARSVGAVMDLLDVERVEVLRGPQGTLFGRNALGGAIAVHSRRPGDQARADAQAQIGSDRMANLTATASGPVAGGLFGSLTLGRRKRDGYVTRTHDGLDMGDDDGVAARGALVWRPADGFQVFATADYSRIRENGAPTVSGGVNDRMAFGAFGNALLPECAAISINPGFPGQGPPTFPPPGAGTGGAPGCHGPETFPGEYVAGGTFPAYANLDARGTSAEVTWSPGERITLRSITGYRELVLKASRDADNTPANILATRETLDHAQISEELQVSGFALARRLHWQTGLYLFREDGYQSTDVTIPPGALHSGGYYDNRSGAAFLQVTGDLGDAASLTLGGRYTRDRKGYTPDLYALGDASQGPGSIFAPTWPRLAGSYLSPSGPMRPGDRMLPLKDFSEDFDALTFMASLAYRWSDGLMSYLTFAEGFKSGGFDARFPAPPPGHEPNSPTAEPTTFKPETVASYELGVKSDLLDNRMRLNLAFFRADYEDVQIIIRESFNPVTFNGGSAEMSGVELEATWIPVGGWEIAGSMGMLNAEYEELSESVLNNATPVLPGYRLAKAPRFSHSLGVGKSSTLSGVVLTPRVNWSFNGSQYHDAINTPQLFQDGYSLLNASVTLATHDGRWEMVCDFRNLTGQTYLVNGNSSFATASAYVELVYARPFEWSVSLKRTL